MPNLTAGLIHLNCLPLMTGFVALFAICSLTERVEVDLNFLESLGDFDEEGAAWRRERKVEEPDLLDGLDLREFAISPGGLI